MPPSDFANADLNAIANQLTTDECILLTAGVGFWRTHEIPRLGVPAIKVSDGPNGIRGNHFFMSTPAKCLPSSTAMGATFDPELMRAVGLKLLAPEAKHKFASTVLGPTCNIQRNPLGGRSFESFSEDPYLSGIISAAYVNGVQEGGIGCTIKHFVCNDKEDERMKYDSIVSPRALREIYLMPFMLAEKLAKPWSYMTAYNRVNGTHVSESPLILKDILRDEWKFDGMVMSDWFGVYSIDHSLNAGLDLEMPGLNKWRSLDLMNRSVVSGKITTRTLKERATKVLEFVQRCAKGAPEILDGDGIERTVTTDEEIVFMRRFAAETIVLLKNDKAILPLKPKTYKKVAIVGGNAKSDVLSGGGSAALKPSYFVSPYDGIVNAIKAENPDVEILYSEGARAGKILPGLNYEIVTEDGKPGWIGTWYSHENDNSMTPLPTPVYTLLIDETRVFFSDYMPPGITKRWTLKLEGVLKPRSKDEEFEFGIEVAGRARLHVDGKLIIDNGYKTRQRRGDAFFGVGSCEERGVCSLKAGIGHKVLVEFTNVRAPADGDEDETVMDSNPGIRLGGAEVVDQKDLLQEAIGIAKEAEIVIAVVGMNGDWETEGNDRTSLALPGATDELIAGVAAANPNTVVVTQSGSSVLLPWAGAVPALVHSWYLGNATGDAIADVLIGRHNPSGKLSLTFPAREEDVPSHGHFGLENGKVRYGEDLFVGYKHYQHRNIKPLFSFGHGLSYTTFEFSSLKISEPVKKNDDITITLSVDIANTGSVAGSEVVQAYTSLPKTSIYTHPPAQLKGFKKVFLEPGQSTTVTIDLNKYAVSYWNEYDNNWAVEIGEYGVNVGSGSDNAQLSGSFAVKEAFVWNGL